MDLAARRHAVAAFVKAWRAEISAHFDDEERLLLALTNSAQLRGRLLEEHRVLRSLAERCERDADGVAGEPEVLRRLGTLLHDHIRWEEREFFEAVQREQPGALAALMLESANIEERRPGARRRGWQGTDRGEEDRT